MATDEDTNGQTIAAVDRALHVLRYFGESAEPSLGVTEIAHALDLSKAAVHRVLSSFRAQEFLLKDPDTQRYSLGPALVHLGLSYLDRIDVRAVARPAMEKLSTDTDETATLSIRSGWSRIYIDQVTPRRDVKMVVALGSAVPLHAGASSKVLLAHLPEAEQEEFFAQSDLEKLTDETSNSERKLRRELIRINERGYATSMGERLNGAASVAAPVLGHDGSIAAVMSVSGPIERFGRHLEDVAVQLLAATADVSRQVGYRA